MMLVMPMGLASCSDNKTTPQQNLAEAVIATDTVMITDTLNSEVRLMAERQVVVERVRDIFGMVRAHQLKTGGQSPNDLFDKVFCSKAWNKVLMSVRAKEYETNTLFFEIDHWLMTRNIGLVTFDEFECSRIAIDENQNKRATVDFLVYEMDTYGPARVELVYEDDHWVIDNFYDMRTRLDVRGSMLQYMVTDVL
jgi:hypothetical protein